MTAKDEGTKDLDKAPPTESRSPDERCEICGGPEVVAVEDLAQLIVDLVDASKVEDALDRVRRALAAAYERGITAGHRDWEHEKDRAAPAAPSTLLEITSAELRRDVLWRELIDQLLGEVGCSRTSGPARYEACGDNDDPMGPGHWGQGPCPPCKLAIEVRDALLASNASATKSPTESSEYRRGIEEAARVLRAARQYICENVYGWASGQAGRLVADIDALLSGNASPQATPSPLMTPQGEHPETCPVPGSHTRTACNYFRLQLAKYGRHLAGCTLGPRDCSCGLQQAVEARAFAATPPVWERASSDAPKEALPGETK